MLYSTVLRFQAAEDGVVSPTAGSHAYAMFLNLLGEANKVLAQRVHDLDGSKPFTISPLQGRFRRHQSGLRLSAGAEYWMRFTFLQEDLFACFLDETYRFLQRCF